MSSRPAEFQGPGHSGTACGDVRFDDRHSDQDLLDGCRAGRADAWEALVARYEALIFSVAIHGGVSREDAADITQATFAALLDGMPSLRDDDRLSSWLVTVALRQLSRTRRRLERERPSGLYEQLSVDPAGEWERVAALQEALRHLGSPCGELIHALYFDHSQPTYTVIARRMGRAVGGLGPMRARCLERLRSLLGEDF